VRFTRWKAAAVLLALASAWAWCLEVAFSTPTLPVHIEPGETDADLYGRVVERVREGEDYYEAVDREFERVRYPVVSLFNYRTPLYAWFFSLFARPAWPKLIVGLLALCTLLLSYTTIRRSPGRVAGLLSVVLMSGALMLCLFEGMYLYTEAWAGTLIALSIAAYALRKVGLGVLTGLLALFFRELALPYCALAGLVALWHRRWREVTSWLIGFALYAQYFAWHAYRTLPGLPAAGEALDMSSWVRFGGMEFLLAASRANIFLIAAPAWVAAICLPLAVLGLAGGRSDLAQRSLITVAVYLLLFAIVGKLDTFYWGMLITPLLALGIALSPWALGDLAKAVRKANS
jgi:hypothetical protein